MVKATTYSAEKKYSHYTGGTLGKGFDGWKQTATRTADSWWLTWAEWLITLSGKEMTAPAKPGNNTYTVIEPAPGSYVKEKC